MQYLTLTSYLNDSVSTFEAPIFTPGGNIGDAGTGLLSEGDLYLCEVARTLKGQDDRWQKIELLQRRKRQLANQIHFTKDIDHRISDRLELWIRELME